VVSDAGGDEVSDFVGEYAVSDPFISAAVNGAQGPAGRDHALRLVSLQAAVRITDPDQVCWKGRYEFSSIYAKSLFYAQTNFFKL
jgi:hypothetical protein